MTYLAHGGEDRVISRAELSKLVQRALDSLGERKRVLALPPDYTRFHSRAGEITEDVWRYYGKRLADVLPAIGTHVPVSDEEREHMFGETPADLFRVHRWRQDLATLGTVPGSFISEVSEGKLDYDWPAQVNELLVAGGHDLILSIGQVLPHEVVGMANHSKNVFVGTGGAEGINKSHFLGAVYGMERMMGRGDTPVRKVLNYASEHFAQELPIVYILTVVGRDASGELVTRGLFIGDDGDCFRQAVELSQKVNITFLEKPVRRAVAYLDEREFKTTWLGNKAIYRLRMAMADEGELIVLGPGLHGFGEDAEIDRLIRKYGYVGTDRVLVEVDQNEELQANLSAAAHLIHGSSEGRFRIRLCPGGLSREEVESVNYQYGELSDYIDDFNPATMKDGWTRMPDGEKVFFVSQPATGLWSTRERFNAG
jgi:nickel-dependent lactate racemase